MQKAKIKMQSDEAKVKSFCILNCNFDVWPLIFDFL